MSFNSDNFNLQNWKLTLPVDERGGILGDALEIKNLIGYESSYFYDAPDGAMVFSAYANGATTSGSTYPRAELREMNNGDLASWNLKQGGTMTATLKVDHVPTLSGGESGRIIVGQIHGEDEELIRLYWDNNTVYFMNDIAGSDGDETKFNFLNDEGKSPVISLGEKFSYKIDARGDMLHVEIHADGEVYTSTSKINSAWQSDTFYFKAGVYMGVNEDSGTGLGKVSFYGLDFGHTAGSGLGGLDPSQPQPNPNPPTPDLINIAGTNGHDILTGNKAGNIIRAASGDDVVNGAEGNDTLYGDAGTDVLYGGTGNDQIIGGTGNDTATGGEGQDTFIVARGDNILFIHDFTVSGSKDTVLIKGYTASEIALAQLTQNGADTVLRLSDGAAVTFNDLTAADMKNANFQTQIGNTVSSFVPKGLSGTPTPTLPDPTPNLPLQNVGTNSADKLIGTDKKHDVISARAGNDILDGNDGNDKLYGESGNDTLYGNDDNDYLDGGVGNDMLYGEDGGDRLYGGIGADKLYGNQGEDILNGGLGQDTLFGGDGEDVFVFSQRPDIHDIISDFDVEEDKVDISGLLGANGMVSIQTVAGDSGLYVDIDGTGSAKAILVATFEEKINSSELENILV